MTRNKKGSGSPGSGSPSDGNRTRGNLQLITMESIQSSHRQPWLTSSVSSSNYFLWANFSNIRRVINSLNHAVSIILIYAIRTSKHLCWNLCSIETLQNFLKFVAQSPSNCGHSPLVMRIALMLYLVNPLRRRKVCYYDFYYDLCNPPTKKGFSVNIKKTGSFGRSEKVNNTPRRNIFRVMWVEENSVGYFLLNALIVFILCRNPSEWEAGRNRFWQIKEKGYRTFTYLNQCNTGRDSCEFDTLTSFVCFYSLKYSC